MVRLSESSELLRADRWLSVVKSGQKVEMTKQRKRRHESGTPEKEEGATEELKAFIEEKTGEAVKEIKKALDQRITGIEESLSFAYASIETASRKVCVLESELKAMHEDWQSMNYRLRQLEQEREEADRLRRRPQLIFAGRDLHIPERDDRLQASIAAMINRLLEIEVSQGQIVYVKRLPRNRLLVHFTGDERGSLRDQVFRAKHKLRGQRIFINENLTPVRQEALNLLLHERKEGRISTVLTRGGEVLFAVTRADRLTKVRSREEAEHILGLITARPPPSTEPGDAHASDPQRSRASGQAVGPLVGAGRPHSGESTGARESPVPAPGGGREERAEPSQWPDTARSLEPPLPARLCLGAVAERGGGVPAGEARMDRGAASAYVPGLARNPTLPSHLGTPLTERPGTGGSDKLQVALADAERCQRREQAEEGGRSPGQDEAPSDPAALDSPMTEVRCVGGERTAGLDGMGEEEGVSGRGLLNSRGRVGSRTSSAPPCHRRDGGEHASLCDARRLSEPEGTSDQEGADRGSRAAASVTRSGGSYHKTNVSVKGKTGDIRAYLK